jgi:hypothetical protein
MRKWDYSPGGEQFPVWIVAKFPGHAQAPAKKSELTVADREAWQKVLGWPVELEEQWRRSRTTNEPAQSGLIFHSLGLCNLWFRPSL